MDTCEIAITTTISVVAIYLLTPKDLHLWMLASMGAAHVLFLKDAESSLPQFIGWNVLAALVGISFSLLIVTELVAVIAALALILIMMKSMNNFHPPAGATVILAALQGPVLGYIFIGCILIPNLCVMSLIFMYYKWRERRRIR